MQMNMSEEQLLHLPGHAGQKSSLIIIDDRFVSYSILVACLMLTASKKIVEVTIPLQYIRLINTIHTRAYTLVEHLNFFN